MTKNVAVQDVAYVSQMNSKVLIDIFINKYFTETKNVIAHEKDFFISNNLRETRVDYFRLKRFIVTALRRFHELDQRFLSGLLLKLYKDVESLFDYIHTFTVKTKFHENVFQTEFLPSIPAYKALYQNLKNYEKQQEKYENECFLLEEKIKKTKLSLHNANAKQVYREAKLLLGDAAHNFALAKQEKNKLLEEVEFIKNLTHKLFISTFKQKRDEYLKELTKYANVKAFYLDKLLWDKASQTTSIKIYLATSQIDGDYDTKTFLKYYLKNINAENVADQEWHSFLNRVMSIL